MEAKCHYFFFYKIREQDGGMVLPWGVSTSERGEEIGKGYME
jgi:hypothetical protein